MLLFCIHRRDGNNELYQDLRRIVKVRNRQDGVATDFTFDELLRRLKQLYCFDKMDDSMAETNSTDFEADDPWQAWCDT